MLKTVPAVLHQYRDGLPSKGHFLVLALVAVPMPPAVCGDVPTELEPVAYSSKIVTSRLAKRLLMLDSWQSILHLLSHLFVDSFAYTLAFLLLWPSTSTASC